MQNMPIIRISTLFFLSLAAFVMTGCDGVVPTRTDIVAQYPSVDQGSLRLENANVLCPFVRMLERSGMFDAAVAGQPTMTVSVASVTTGAKEFGCATLECGVVAQSVSGAQGLTGIDIEKLHLATGIAHDCGMTFALGGTSVSDVVRQATLARFSQLADVDGHLIYDDILTAKLEICASQGVVISNEGEIETKLLYAYLGGMDRGYVLLSDVEKFLHAEMPETKSLLWINTALINSVI